MDSAPPLCRVGNDLKVLQDRTHFGRALRLRGAHNNVFTPVAAAAALIEHLEGFANARAVAEENLELSTALATLLQVNLREDLFGSGARRRIIQHENYSPWRWARLQAERLDAPDAGYDEARGRLGRTDHHECVIGQEGIDRREHATRRGQIRLRRALRKQMLL